MFPRELDAYFALEISLPSSLVFAGECSRESGIDEVSSFGLLYGESAARRSSSVVDVDDGEDDPGRRSHNGFRRGILE